MPGHKASSRPDPRGMSRPPSNRNLSRAPSTAAKGGLEPIDVERLSALVIGDDKGAIRAIAALNPDEPDGGVIRLLRHECNALRSSREPRAELAESMTAIGPPSDSL